MSLGRVVNVGGSAIVMAYGFLMAAGSASDPIAGTIAQVVGPSGPQAGPAGGSGSAGAAGAIVAFTGLVMAVAPILVDLVKARWAREDLRRQLGEARHQIEQLKAHAAEAEARSVEIEDRSAADRKRIRELEQVAQQIPANTAMAAKAEAKAEAALSAIRVLCEEGYLSSGSDPELAIAAPVAPPDQRPRLLVIEDHPTTANAIRKLFEARGWWVDRAECHDIALDKIGGDFDWVVLDLMLPGGGGEDVLARIREHFPDRKVAVVTGIEDQGRIAGLIGLRPDAILIKPVPHSLLFRTITPVIDRLEPSS